MNNVAVVAVLVFVFVAALVAIFVLSALVMMHFSPPPSPGPSHQPLPPLQRKMATLPLQRQLVPMVTIGRTAAPF